MPHFAVAYEDNKDYHFEVCDLTPEQCAADKDHLSHQHRVYNWGRDTVMTKERMVAEIKLIEKMPLTLAASRKSILVNNRKIKGTSLDLGG